MNDHEVLLSSLRRLAASRRSLAESEVLLFRTQHAISQTRESIHRSDTLIESMLGGGRTPSRAHGHWEMFRLG
jgi:hypothetical protein